MVCDLGETLVDESALWSELADQVGVPRFTFMATLGGLIARGGTTGRFGTNLALIDPGTGRNTLRRTSTRTRQSS